MVSLPSRGIVCALFIMTFGGIKGLEGQEGPLDPCARCTPCGPSGEDHFLTGGYTYPIGHVIGGSHGCVSEECPGPHSECGLGKRGALETEERLQGIARAQGDQLLRLIEPIRDSVAINRIRGSLQMYGCGGEIVADVPLDREQLALLASWQGAEVG